VALVLQYFQALRVSSDTFIINKQKIFKRKWNNFFVGQKIAKTNSDDI